MPTNAPVKFGMAGSGRFVGENAGVELLRQPAPVVVHAFDAIGEVESLVIHFDAQMHGLAGGDGDGRREGVGLRRVGHAGHHAQMFADGLVVREVEVVELGAVVVADQPGQLLEMFRLEFDDRGRAEAMRLLAARDE